MDNTHELPSSMVLAGMELVAFVKQPPTEVLGSNKVEIHTGVVILVQPDDLYRVAEIVRMGSSEWSVIRSTGNLGWVGAMQMLESKVDQ